MRRFREARKRPFQQRPRRGIVICLRMDRRMKDNVTLVQCHANEMAIKREVMVCTK